MSPLLNFLLFTILSSVVYTAATDVIMARRYIMNIDKPTASQSTGARCLKSDIDWDNAAGLSSIKQFQKMSQAAIT